MNTNTLEPDSIRIFRYFAIFQWILVFLALCGDDTPNISFGQIQIFPTTFLVLYLAIPRWLRWMRGWYLPIALAVNTITPMFSVYAAAPNGPEPGVLIIWLFVPFVLISAQYKLRHIILFNVFTVGLEIGLAYLAQADRETVVSGIFIRVLLFGMVGYIVLRLMEAQRLHRHELAIANAKLVEFASTQEQLVVSRERNRMARDLHDVLAHTLTAVSVQLNALKILIETDPDAAQQTLQTLQNLTHEGLTETRNALQALRSNPVKDMGLSLALKNLAVATAERKELQLTLDLPRDDTLLPMLYQQNIYRVAEEALINIVRHAEASALTLSLKIGRVIELMIRDNGVGFDSQTAPDGHYGLVGMQERALLCHGKLTIESEIGQGTTIRLIIERATA